MSIQTEITRLAAAKNDLKTALTAKGVTVPAGTRLDGYSALLAQIPGADAYLDKDTYDPRGFGRDIFADIAYLYTALYLLDGWTEASAENKAKGYNYTQTVTLVPDDDGAPAVTAASKFLPQMGASKTGNTETDSTLREALNIIADGMTDTGPGTVTTLVQEKPYADIPVVWAIRTEG